jgi:hypothetical protein
MATVTLRFTPPTDEGITKLHVYESVAIDGTYYEVASTTSVGTYPTYIDTYVVTTATSPVGWFAIEWENSVGERSDLSASIQGGTETLVNEVAQGILLRDPSLSETIVYQEAAFVVAEVMGTNDPWSLTTEDATVRQLQGMIYLALARSIIVTTVVSSSSATSSYTAGLISEKQDSKTNQSIFDNVAKLIEMANLNLGLNTSVVMQMEDIRMGISTSRWQIDQSRLIREVEII